MNTLETTTTQTTQGVAAPHSASAPSVSVPRGASGYDPYAIHRKVRLDHVVPGHMIVCKTYSFTEEGTDTQYQPAIDSDGYLNCNCRDFQFRCDSLNPHILSHPDKMCKHTIRAVLGRAAKGDIELPEEQIQALKKAMHRTKRENTSKPARTAFVPTARKAPMTKEEIKRNLEAADLL